MIVDTITSTSKVAIYFCHFKTKHKPKWIFKKFSEHICTSQINPNTYTESTKPRHYVSIGIILRKILQSCKLICLNVVDCLCFREIYYYVYKVSSQYEIFNIPHHFLVMVNKHKTFFHRNENMNTYNTQKSRDLTKRKGSVIYWVICDERSSTACIILNTL